MTKEEYIDWSLYDIYKDGRIYSNSYNYKRFLKGRLINGYVQVGLKCVDGKYRLFYWHRVIWTYFNGAIPEGMQVNHINELKTDNRLCNLELVTPKQNCNHATRNERIAASNRGRNQSEETKQKISESHKGKKLSDEHKTKLSEILTNNPLKSKPVVAVDKNNNVVFEFPSCAEAGRNGFGQGNVSACCRNCYYGSNYYKGYYWYFKEDYLRMKGIA